MTSRPVQSYESLKAPKPAKVRARVPRVSAKRQAARDPEKQAFVARQKCLCWSVDPAGCQSRVTVHHDREHGGKRDDRKTLPLCSGHHQIGPRAVHRLGREKFQEVHRLDLAAECAFYEGRFQAWKEGVET